MTGKNDILISVQHVSKKFCKDLKRSMIYGAKDIFSDLFHLKPQVDTLRKKEFWALKDISFELRRGEVLGILGNNGSGKTTLMRLICGIYPFEKGVIEVNGHVAPLFALRSGYNPYFSGKENIYIKGAMHGMSRQQISNKLDEIIAFAELEGFIDAPLGNYSSGMRARLGFSVAIASGPDILIIDEGLTVGDVEFREKCFHKIRSMASRIGVIFISHNERQVEDIATRILILGKGENILETGEVHVGIGHYLEQFFKPQKEQG